MKSRLENRELGIEVKITDRCNQHCFHCMNNDSVSSGTDLDVDLFLQKLDEWICASREIGVGIREVRITGGEPLLRAEAVMRIARRCLAASIPCGINTNASLLTEELARQLKQAGLKTVKISLDATEAEVFQRVRGNHASLPKVLAGIKNAVCQDFHVILRFTLCEFNKDQLLPCYETGRDLGVDKFQVKPLIPAGRGFSVKAFLDQQQILGAIEELKNTMTASSPELEVLCWIPEMRGDLSTKVCGSIDKVYIKTNMEIITCNYLPETLPIGNMLEDSFSRIYTARVACNIMSNRGISVLEKCPQLVNTPAAAAGS